MVTEPPAPILAPSPFAALAQAALALRPELGHQFSCESGLAPPGVSAHWMSSQPDTPRVIPQGLGSAQFGSRHDAPGSWGGALQQTMASSVGNPSIQIDDIPLDTNEETNYIFGVESVGHPDDGLDIEMSDDWTQERGPACVGYATGNARGQAIQQRGKWSFSAYRDNTDADSDDGHTERQSASLAYANADPDFFCPDVHYAIMRTLAEEDQSMEDYAGTEPLDMVRIEDHPRVPDFSLPRDQQMEGLAFPSPYHYLHHNGVVANPSPAPTPDSVDSIMTDDGSECGRNGEEGCADANNQMVEGAGGLGMPGYSSPASAGIPSGIIVAEPAPTMASVPVLSGPTSRVITLPSPPATPPITPPITPTAMVIDSDTRQTLVPIARLKPREPAPLPAAPPIEIDLASSPDAPKLEKRFVVSKDPVTSAYNIRSLDRDHQPERDLDTNPRLKIAYTEEFEDHDGYRQKVLWSLRGLPPMDWGKVHNIEQLMDENGVESAKSCRDIETSIVELIAQEKEAKRKHNEAKLAAKKKAEATAYLKRQHLKREGGPPPVLFSEYFTSPVRLYSSHLLSSPLFASVLWQP
ncbi:hypothetical protein ONZ43_g6957 [Nemania bipapillata]|uniref:Uncharacterized protein n=1 Tax=Nemania bipapillata TaxID=110536 RepID=A0ACC2HUI1_9PEZI|nr:hypothetical protein ONZ43_g6957 [Nemania bipapillata]